jgi:hypothetical protein
MMFVCKPGYRWAWRQVCNLSGVDGCHAWAHCWASWRACRAYVDGTFCRFGGVEEQLGILEQVIAQVRKYRLLLEPSSCNLFVCCVLYFWACICGCNCIWPVTVKVAIIVAPPLVAPS